MLTRGKAVGSVYGQVDTGAASRENEIKELLKDTQFPESEQSVIMKILKKASEPINEGQLEPEDTFRRLSSYQLSGNTRKASDYIRLDKTLGQEGNHYLINVTLELVMNYIRGRAAPKTA